MTTQQILFVGGPQHGRWHDIACDAPGVFPVRCAVQGALYTRRLVTAGNPAERGQAWMVYEFEGWERPER